MSKGKLTRPKSGTETLPLSDCPLCGGEIEAGDCGYADFNPGWAKCLGCKHEWKLGYVNTAWDAGEEWNRLAAKVNQRVGMINFLRLALESFESYTVGPRGGRDFQHESMCRSAAEFLDQLDAEARRVEEVERE